MALTITRTLGAAGSAFDPPGPNRAYTYQQQPGNVGASRIGEACDRAMRLSAGDWIDRGLGLLKELQIQGFGVFEIDPAAPPAEAQWPGLIEWLASGDRGLSSDQIVTSLCGLDARSKSFRDDHPSYPRDPDDLARCLKLLDAVPALNQNFHRMALVSKEWAALVAFWDDLVALMILEAPRFRTQGRAPKTYALMKAALAGTKEGEK